MANLGISRDVEFHTFGQERLHELLKLQVLPFARKREPFKQLAYIEEYVGELIGEYEPTNKFGTVVVETHYIDRDYIEDHSVFYSRNLFPYKNFCRRLHFFCLAKDAVREQLRLAMEARRGGVANYREACAKLSRDAYLGFCVVKPLDGCPVGRTVLRTYVSNPTGRDYRREFRCTRDYRAHLLGAELTVEGLAFQQQDAGVSACATTAIWSSLHHLRSFEDVAAATPAQITNLASENNLPFGRPMPSEGLSLGQMCQAIQAVGVSPTLVRVDDYATARVYLYAATLSGMAPILVISNERARHAVTVAGIKVSKVPTTAVTEGISDSSAALQALYVHDDRMGPYWRGLLEKVKDDKTGKDKPVVKLGRENPEPWLITHVLLAMHPKIRLSFKGLYDAGLEVAKQTQGLITAYFKQPRPTVELETRIIRGFRYVEELVSEPAVKTEVAELFARSVAMPRYVGLIRISTPSTGIVDVLLDTTGTPRNLHAIAVVGRGTPAAYTSHAVRFLAKRFEPLFFG